MTLVDPEHYHEPHLAHKPVPIEDGHPKKPAKSPSRAACIAREKANT